MHGARLCQCEAGVQAALFRGVVDRDQHLGIATFAADGERRGKRSLTRRDETASDDAVGREPAQPQAKQALRG